MRDEIRMWFMYLYVREYYNQIDAALASSMLITFSIDLNGLLSFLLRTPNTLESLPLIIVIALWFSILSSRSRSRRSSRSSWDCRSSRSCRCSGSARHSRGARDGGSARCARCARSSRCTSSGGRSSSCLLLLLFVSGGLCGTFGRLLAFFLDLAHLLLRLLLLILHHVRHGLNHGLTLLS